MTITVEITGITTPDENHDALLGVVAAANAERDVENVRRAAATPPLDALPALTTATYCEATLNRVIASYAAQARANRVKQLEALTNSLSYAKRTEIVAAVVAIATEP